MKRTLVLAALLSTVALPAFGAPSAPRHRVAELSLLSLAWQEVRALLGLKADPPPPPPPTHYTADGGTCINPDGCKPTP